MFEDYRNMLSTVVFYNRASLSDYGFMIEKSLDYRLIEDNTNSCYVVFPDLKPGAVILGIIILIITLIVIARKVYKENNEIVASCLLYQSWQLC